MEGAGRELHRPLRVGAWLLGAGVSAALSAAPWTIEASPATPPTPRPLPRQPSAAELESLDAAELDLNAALSEARLRLGRPLRVEELEATDAAGRPHLTGGLVDNPLVAGAAGVAAWCPGDAPPPTMDWRYCPETGRISATRPAPTERR